uniref:Kinesin-like protein n=1 Tax=Romanomermis culicivorax TaxID=13658 RepID=A0A915HME0_ROMCU
MNLVEKDEMTLTLKALRSPFVPKTPGRRNRNSFYRTPRSVQPIFLCNRDLGVRRNKDLKLAFDYVFDSSATNNDVFELTTKNMLDHLMDVFAYGATGAGKTHTMLGTYESPGVISRTMNELYGRIEAVKDDLICSVEVSYLEIYNETVRDLLNPESGQLAIREDGGCSLTIAGLTQHKPDNAKHLFDMLESGNKNRTQHPTDANKESSRSHAVFQVHLKQSPRNAGLSNDVLISKMVLVDLAGSERATATRNCGDRMREGANINRSLLALGNCINALAEGKKGGHIPYRDSKLTRILKDALGGNCHTLMIANVSPSYLSYDDTQNTLKYADRAKQIKADLRKNVYRVDQHIHQYGKIVQDLQTELLAHMLTSKNFYQPGSGFINNVVEDLKAKYKQSQASLSEAIRQKSEIQCELEQLKSHQNVSYNCRSDVKILRDRLTSYIELQNQILNHESQKKLLLLKINTRDEMQSFLNLLDYDPARNEVNICHTKRIKSQYEMKMHRIDEELVDLRNDLLENSSKITDSFTRMNFNAHFMAENPVLWINETKSVQQQALAAHYKSLFKSEHQMSKHMEKVISASFLLNREQHLILSSYDRLTSSLKMKFEDLIKLIELHRDISWKDNEDGDSVSFERLTLEDYSLTAPNFDDGGKNCFIENFSNKENVGKTCNLGSVFSMPTNGSQSVRSTLKPIENVNRIDSRRSPPTRTLSCSNCLAPTPQFVNKSVDDDIFKRPAIPPARYLKPYLPPPPLSARPNSRSPSKLFIVTLGTCVIYYFMFFQ